MKQANADPYQKAWYVAAILRIALGILFLWAFFDKLFGFGIATPPGKSWLSGGSPTSGFLLSTDGYFSAPFQAMAGSDFIDWLFMIGLFGLGMALLLGIGLRIAACAGTILLTLMWAARLPLENNPLIDEHSMYILVLWLSAVSVRKLSLIDYWLRLSIVRRHAWLW